eukprot:m.274365 g.274365  ORF g.274365 m.274365 type:complete len:228 (+) comp26895_c2_seq18:205-888(+)
MPAGFTSVHACGACSQCKGRRTKQCPDVIAARDRLRAESQESHGSRKRSAPQQLTYEDGHICEQHSPPPAVVQRNTRWTDATAVRNREASEDDISRKPMIAVSGPPDDLFGQAGETVAGDAAPAKKTGAMPPLTQFLRRLDQRPGQPQTPLRTSETALDAVFKTTSQTVKRVGRLQKSGEEGRALAEPADHQLYRDHAPKKAEATIARAYQRVLGISYRQHRTTSQT